MENNIQTASLIITEFNNQKDFSKNIPNYIQELMVYYGKKIIENKPVKEKSIKFSKQQKNALQILSLKKTISAYSKTPHKNTMNTLYNYGLVDHIGETWELTDKGLKMVEKIMKKFTLEQ